MDKEPLMNNEPRAQRLPWLIGLVLLLGTALGTGWFLNYTPAEGDSYADKDRAPTLTVCLGQVDADPGVTKLFPAVAGRVLQVVAEGKEVFNGEVLLKLDSRLAEFKLREAEA